MRHGLDLQITAIYATTRSQKVADRMGGRSLSLETALSLLTEKRRQYIIYQLRAETTPVRVADLAERIADAESGELFTPTSNL